MQNNRQNNIDYRHIEQKKSEMEQKKYELSPISDLSVLNFDYKDHEQFKLEAEDCFSDWLR
jgi:hypothetical protein